MRAAKTPRSRDFDCARLPSRISNAYDASASVNALSGNCDDVAFCGSVSSTKEGAFETRDDNTRLLLEESDHFSSGTGTVILARTSKLLMMINSGGFPTN